MKKQFVLKLGLVGCFVGALTGCSSTKVATTSEYNGLLPKPDPILVYDFAVSPDEVKLDSGISAEIQQAMNGEPRTEQEIAAGRQVADALAKHLVEEIQKLGFAVDRASGPPPKRGNLLLIQGQYLSIDEGNRTERVVIGLGLGRTDVKTSVQVYDLDNGPRILVRRFETDAKSGRKPGAAETMGVGAAAGNLAVSAAVTAGGAAVSETFGATVEADADRTAKDITAKLKIYFGMQGWTIPDGH